MGNTLPHVPDDASLRRALGDVAAVLRPGGRRWSSSSTTTGYSPSGGRFLSALARESKGIESSLFFRFYDFPEAGREMTLTFSVATFERLAGGEWQYRVDATQLLPIASGQLATALGGRAGIGGDAGGMGEPFDPAGSNDLIVIARRR